MSGTVEYYVNKASKLAIAGHLLSCDADFVPPLSHRVDISGYAQKLADKAERFEAWSGGMLVGLVAAYCNDYEGRTAHISNVSVLRAWTGKGIAACLLSQCIEHAKASGMRLIHLEVASGNSPAIRVYQKSGFVAHKADTPSITMNLYLENGEEHEQQA